MGVRYYLSGCARNHTFESTLGEWLAHDISKTGSIVFITGEPDDKYSLEVAAQWFTRELETIGKNFERVYVIAKNTPAYLARKWVKNADMIVMTGGNPFLQKAMCRKMRIWRMLRNFDGVMLGMSAGAMCMSEYIISVPCSEEYPELDIRPGLNRDGISIFPHNNTWEDTYPESLSLEFGETYLRKDVIDASDDAGPYLLLQDIHEDVDGVDVCHHSFIRATDFHVEVMYENNAKAWMADGWKVELLERG